MEITSFVLGMLTIVAVIIVTAIVVGMVKINQLNQKTELLTQLSANIEGDLRRLVEEYARNLSLDVNMVEQTLKNQINHVNDEHHKIEDAIHREIDETRRYIDSRIDKAVVKGTLEGSKQILKG